MELPDGYLDALSDELAPYGFEFGSIEPDDDRGQALCYRADPEGFAREHPDAGIEDSYGSRWPPAGLELWLRFDRHGDPYDISFETIDLLASTASSDPQLNARLNTLDDPADHASAVGEALYAALLPEREAPHDYLE
ncbi:MAG: hypothetical protein WAL91_02345 [Propionicimonas sp.]